MEFPFNINELWRRQICRVENNLLPDRYILDSRKEEKFRKLMTKIVDDIGHASSLAQGLQKVITTAEKLRKSENILYLLKEQKGNKDKGVIIGFIKVGKMKLFLYDLSDKLVEREALCVLDFYVHESMQRKGYGKFLFDHMLQDQNVKPNKLAVNRPSEMCLSFLKKHYDLSKAMHQANKFVVFEEFFPKPKQLMDLLNKSSSEIREDLRQASERARMAVEIEERMNEKAKTASKGTPDKSQQKKEPQTKKQLKRTDYASGGGETIGKKIVNSKQKNGTGEKKYIPPPVINNVKCHHSKHTPLW